MCIGCGICESMLGEQRVEMLEVASGFERPVISQELSHAEIDTLNQVCPGMRVKGLPSSLRSSTAKEDLIWGVWEEIYLCHAADAKVRHRASTGGVLTALALFLIEEKEVDFILHAKASEQNPSFGTAHISRSSEDVLIAAGSRYGPTATLKNIVQILDSAERSQEKFAFIGTPCDVSALRSFAEVDDRVDQYCRFMLTMVCGGFMSPLSLKQKLAEHQIDPEQIASLRYRGHGCPGTTRVTMKTGAVEEISYLDLWGEDESSWGLPTRCKVCPDGIGDSADIAASDTWDGGSPTIESSRSDPGTNAAIVRTRRGTSLLQRAISAGYLSQGNPLTPQDMSRFQPHQLAKKQAVASRFSGMQDAGNLVPETDGLRIDEIADAQPEGENRREYYGAFERVKNGRFTESRPKSNNS